MESIIYAADVPVIAEPDVAVVGGGIAGFCAAIAARRQGADVLLMERFNCLGGNATAGGVGAFCGETSGQGEVFDGIVERLAHLSAIADYRPYSEREARPFDHEWLKFVLQDMAEAEGVRVLLHATLVAATRSGGEVEGLLVGTKGRLGAVKPKVAIDCSGDGDLVAAAGFSWEKGRESDGLQLPMSYMAFVRDVGENVERPLPESCQPIRSEDDLPMVSIWPEPRGKAGVKIKIPGHDSTDPWGLTAAEQAGRRRTVEVLDWEKRHRLRNYVLDHTPQIIGIREGRRAVGEYVLTEEDVRAGRRFEDGVARGVFYIDFHDPTNDKRTYAMPTTRVPPYDIPYRSLIPQGAVNLLVAGRCFSCEQVALASARVMTTCAMMGQAAGIAAAWAARDGARVGDILADRLRAELISRGAEL